MVEAEAEASALEAASEETTSADSRESSESGDSSSESAPPAKRRSLALRRDRSGKGKRGDHAPAPARARNTPARPRSGAAARRSNRKDGSPFQKATPIDVLVRGVEERLKASGKNDRPFFPES